jgi:hypothetical protein
MRLSHIVLAGLAGVVLLTFALGLLFKPLGPAQPRTAPAPPIGSQQGVQSTADTTAGRGAREDYAQTLEGHLLSIGIDAHVRAHGVQRDILRVSWAAMSRPVVYNMMNSPGLRVEVPALGFRKIVLTDDGGFGGTLTPSTWVYHWDRVGWQPGGPPEEIIASRAAEARAEKKATKEAEEFAREQTEKCKKYADLPAYAIPAGCTAYLPKDTAQSSRDF